MKISPEPNWNQRYVYGAAGLHDQPVEEHLKMLLNRFTNHSPPVIRVRDKNGEALGSFTPEWFLSLSREHQLRFLSVAKRLHDRGVDR